MKEAAREAGRVYGYFNNHFRWQVRKGENRWGYPGAAKNLVELLGYDGASHRQPTENPISHSEVEKKQNI